MLAAPGVRGGPGQGGRSLALIRAPLAAPRPGPRGRDSLTEAGVWRGSGRRAMGPPAETDLYRDTWARYLGYANEIGESFRAIVPISLVWASYGVATTYVTADAIDKGKKAAVGMPGAGSKSRSQRGQLQHFQECGRGCFDPCYRAGDRGQSLLALTHHPMVAREQGAMCHGLGERARGGPGSPSDTAVTWQLPCCVSAALPSSAKLSSVVCS
ncbi:mitochondrial fission process protein 1 isoform X2 [Dermochelys coriacea]|uniref:mitochondrial fission process protein 1 isoform X2 n=1 Tax=Dermochelys coriacea TaxID=27794 RepID=UPI001CA91D42|nr:mitochondrial fission process protein 1 isoform X2 [Dermochelys coriacea]XP_043354071.1 mitochondrial fission process protein 1 isoform X2 [Dermochelys coriacea]XP_043354072.1 mitochondrial fission process protein 1 isoform X2 [Dermochelys coriacea]